MSSAEPSSSSLKTSREFARQADGISLEDGYYEANSNDSLDSDAPYTRLEASHLTQTQMKSFKGRGRRTEMKDRLDDALLKLTMMDALRMDVRSEDTIQTEPDSDVQPEKMLKPASMDQLCNLRQQLLQREAEVEALRAAFEESWNREKKLFERICQLESIFSTKEREEPKSRVSGQGSTGAHPQATPSPRTEPFNRPFPNIKDAVIVEKLNLAYEDLAAIYDLRSDIDQQLNDFHHGLIDPVLRKQIVKHVREKELELRSQRVLK